MLFTLRKFCLKISILKQHWLATYTSASSATTLRKVTQDKRRLVGFCSYEFGNGPSAATERLPGPHAVTGAQNLLEGVHVWGAGVSASSLPLMEVKERKMRKADGRQTMINNPSKGSWIQILIQAIVIQGCIK